MRSSSTSRDQRTPRHRLCAWLLAALAAAAATRTASAIDPDRAMSQYIRDQWGIEQGFPGGSVHAITQTADGYLWIGAEKGLIRFDGVTFRLIHPATATSSVITTVLGLLAAPDGSLWVRLRGPLTLRYRDGALEDAMTRFAHPPSVVSAMTRGRNGAVLMSAIGPGTFAYRAGTFETLVPGDALPRSPVIAMTETPGGDIWMGTRDAGLFRLSGRQLSAVTEGLPDQKINSLLPDDERALWIGTDNGVVRWNGTAIATAGVPAAFRNIQALAMIEDRDANIWVGTAKGLLRSNARGVSALGGGDGRWTDAVTALFEDREGNLWVGSTRGIERLRDSAFVTYTASEGLPSDSIGPVHVDAQDRAWFAPAAGGLSWVQGDRVGRVTTAGLDTDVVYSLAGRAGELWVGRQRGGLTHLREQNGTFTARTYTQADGLPQNSVYAVHQNRDGAVWIGTLSAGVSRLVDGRVTTYTSADGLASNTVASIVEGADGTMWFATPNGVSTLSNGMWRGYAARDGLPSNQVNCLFQDAKGVTWIGTADGLAFVDAGRVHRLSAPPVSLRDQILGLAEDTRGALWIATSSHVLRVTRDALLRGRLGEADVREYGRADGLQGVEGVRRHRSVVADARGRIWFSMNRGLSVVDPARAASPAAPALTQIQSVSADGSPIDLRGAVHIPAGRRRITFNYAGLGLSVPERVKFRYRLEGFDRDWSAPVTAREAVYTNLGPGPYRFRVIASSTDGLWTGSEAAIPFAVDPAFWQAWWFRLAGVLTVVAVAAALYRVRMHQVARQLNVRFEERLAERMRIAQELHDTLLQGFVGASMQLHVAAERVPADSPAKSSLTRVLELMRQVIDEGRNAVRGLRSSSSGGADDLEQALCRIPQEIAVQEQVGFRVIVEGRPRALHPLIRDELYRIGREAIVNAFRHSGAGSVEVELDYAAGHVRLLVRDNGCGIDANVLQSGRDGHWGLSGMRERADRIGARFKVWSRAAAGTEVELLVPGHVAFQFPASDRRRRWWPRKRASQ